MATDEISFESKFVPLFDYERLDASMRDAIDIGDVSTTLMVDIAAAMTYDPIEGEYLKAHVAKELLRGLAMPVFAAFFAELHKQAQLFRRVDASLEKSNGEG